jgi:hypothetical protein
MTINSSNIDTPELRMNHSGRLYVSRKLKEKKERGKPGPE